MSRGCWEAFASERAALARYSNLKRGVGGEINFGQLVERAFEDEGEARAALKETAYYLGLGIANAARDTRVSIRAARSVGGNCR